MTVKEPFHLPYKELEVLADAMDIWSVKFSESILASELVSSLKSNAMPLLTWSMIQKETESQNGSLTEWEIIKKEKICKWLQTSFKPNSEKILKDFIKLNVTEVLDTNGVLESEVNILKPQEEEAQQSVSKERRND